MPADLARELRHATLLAFEEMAFALPLGDAAKPAGATASSQVAFSGPFSGRVVLTVEQAMLPELAANMLGADEPPPAAEQLDALGELTNVVCGNLLPAIAGSQHVFLLEAPGPGEEKGSPVAAISLAFDGGTVAASLYSDGLS